jgi:AsmA protein
MKSKGVKITAALVAAALVALVALPYLVDVDRFRPQLESSLGAVLGREVHVGHMEISLLAGGARVEQISIADDASFNNGSFLEAKSLGVGVSLLSLILSRSPHVTSLTLEEPRLTVIKSPEGKWNFASLGSSNGADQDEAPSTQMSSPSMTSIILDRLRISNATIEIASARADGQATTLRNIDVDLKNVSFDSAMSFVLTAHTDAGKLQIEGEAGPMNRANPDQTPFHATIKVDKANLAQVASLNSSSPFGGILNLQATVASDGSTVHSEGKASADKLRLMGGARAASQTVSIRYATDYAVARKTGIVRNSKIMAGTSTASVSGTYRANAGAMVVHMKIAGNHLPLDSFEGLLPALGIVLPGSSKLHGGTVSANLALDGPVDHIVTSGSAQIANAHVAGFDLGSRMSVLPGMSALKGSSDLSIVNLATRLRIGPEGTHISGLNGQFAGIGSITGDGDVSSSNHLQFKMVAHVANDGAARFGLNHVGLRNLPNDIPFQVVGTTSMPVIIPDLSGMAKTTTKAVVTNAGESMLKKAIESETKSPATTQAQANNKKGGFLHNLFRRKANDKQAAAANTQLAAQKSKF